MNLVKPNPHNRYGSSMDTNMDHLYHITYKGKGYVAYLIYKRYWKYLWPIKKSAYRLYEKYDHTFAYDPCMEIWDHEAEKVSLIYTVPALKNYY